MTKKITRRQILKLATAVVMLPVACGRLTNKTNNTESSKNYFLHGVASGDPDQNSVVIWTRVSQIKGAVQVNWKLSTDNIFTNIIKKGRFKTDDNRDHTVKVLVDDLPSGTKFFYKFEVNGKSSVVGQTLTLADGHIDKLVLALATCANYPFGYFNAYDAIAKDSSIDVVVHMGDYIYEYGVDGFGGKAGKRIGRNHLPSHEILSLDDYRQRHAQYKTDSGSLAMHARHPLIVMWDDHETANNPWMGGASNHQDNEGDWQVRRQASLQAYYEWLPVRDPIHESDRQNYWRHYKFGDLASLITLESRHSGRSEQISLDKNLPKLHNKKQAQDFMRNVVGAPTRNMLSKDMESFLSKELKESKDSGRKWRIIGNPSVMAKTVSPNLQDSILDELRENLTGKSKSKIDKLALLGELGLPEDLDMWDGYPTARERFYQIANDAGASDLLVVSGDSHSFWVNDLYDNNNKSMGVELGATGISSPRSIMQELGTDIMKRYDELNSAQNKEIVWTDGRHRGFIRLEITHQSSHADFIAVSNVESREYQTKIIHSVDIEKNRNSLTFGS